MELLKEILAKALQNEEINIIFPNLHINPDTIVEIACYRALQKIKTVIENDSLSDFECIEEIVRILETIGSNGGNRHDFG